ncbi:MAG: metal ABC transporter ATP-binding protein [Candidatus Algichlamydia australiensis]|nr:metal ABC transporter ATP-binding protein [Chlamydiales bacterium]
MPQIKIEELTFAYKQDPILCDVNVDISAGEFLGVIGPNGGGKTTLLKLLMGFLTPQKGKIFLDNRPPQDLRPAIGYVPQHFDFDTAFPISVKEVVEMGGPNSLPLLKKLKLLEHQNKPFGALSGGQMQRALLARALVSNPKLLLLDEATSCVDAETSEIILNILATLKGNVTILMVTHELPTIINRVDRILCVHRNCSLLKPDEVCEHYAMGLYHPPLLKKEEK